MEIDVKLTNTSQLIVILREQQWVWCNDAHNHTKWLQMVNTWRLHWVKVEEGKKQKFPAPSWMVDGKA